MNVAVVTFIIIILWSYIEVGEMELYAAMDKLCRFVDWEQFNETFE